MVSRLVLCHFPFGGRVLLVRLLQLHPRPLLNALPQVLTRLSPFHLVLRSYIDAELLNALLLRRDCCSVSAAKVGGWILAACPACRCFVVAVDRSQRVLAAWHG